jgi:hypothetical protein
VKRFGDKDMHKSLIWRESFSARRFRLAGTRARHSVMRPMVIALCLLFVSPAHAVERAAYAADVCRLLDEQAVKNGLPVHFFTRLIWRESLFDDQAVSPAGAEGIAQFMPHTAKLRQLKNSFDYREALPASAAYLAFLRERFGNLGLAAAAYNLGEQGTSDWLSGKRRLPSETEYYVLEITGHAAADWRQATAELEIPGVGGRGSFAETCTKLALRQMPAPSATVHRTPRQPWGVILAGGFSESRTLKSFDRIKRQHASVLSEELPLVVRKRDLSRGRKMTVRVVVGRNSRAEADQLCGKLRGLGASCVVLKN